MNFGANVSASVAAQDASGWAASNGALVSSAINGAINGQTAQQTKAELVSFGSVIGGAFGSIIPGIGTALGAALGAALAGALPIAKGTSTFDLNAYRVWVESVGKIGAANASVLSQMTVKQRQVWAYAANRVMAPYHVFGGGGPYWFDSTRPDGLNPAAVDRFSNEVQDPVT